MDFPRLVRRDCAWSGGGDAWGRTGGRGGWLGAVSRHLFDQLSCRFCANFHQKSSCQPKIFFVKVKQLSTRLETYHFYGFLCDETVNIDYFKLGYFWMTSEAWHLISWFPVTLSRLFDQQDNQIGSIVFFNFPEVHLNTSFLRDSHGHHSAYREYNSRCLPEVFNHFSEVFWTRFRLLRATLERYS